jgi:hypothetical protein
VVVKNGKVIVIEIKAAAGRSDIYYFDRKVAFYARKTGRQVNRKLMVTPYADNRARETGVHLGVEICTATLQLWDERGRAKPVGRISDVLCAPYEIGIESRNTAYSTLRLSS